MEGGRNAVQLAIRHAVTAGGLWAGVTRYPEARRGLEKAARFHSAKAATFAGEICSGAAFREQAPEALPDRDAR
jgi:hypothetical protein